MDFTISLEQRQFSESLHDFLRGADTPAAARAWAGGDHEPGLKLWRDLGEIGVAALLVPDEFGGLGAGATDAVLAFEALGYHCVPGPVVETAVVAPTLLTGDDARRWLPELATGNEVATVFAPPQVPLALDADIAALTLRIGQDRVDRVDGELEPVRSIDPTRRLFRVRGDGVPVSAAGGEPAVDLGTLAVAAQLLGAGRRLLDLAGEYAKQRHQYGKPIGQYQAIKHLLADVVTGLELARPLAYGAAVAAEAGAGTVTRDVSAAKVAAADAAYRAARTALQVHGAIGYTAEHDLGLWLTKVRALAGAWGSGAVHRRRVLAALKGDK
ncbi:acyl-CoA dehydrogenase family protein [Amycolatopsis taiwanensis]|uniref:acyl-CoA dehydrogenase family protein n=1 Tax=Amycolatopsis taiwanensis TaxID=342230 RepID=UPI00047F787C|nr:acyl-CoA dehydrogenase family protein [Amycolatopsis taiwanensis]